VKLALWYTRGLHPDATLQQRRKAGVLDRVFDLKQNFALDELGQLVPRTSGRLSLVSAPYPSALVVAVTRHPSRAANA
jgi:hypothetical protein